MDENRSSFSGTLPDFSEKTKRNYEVGRVDDYNAVIPTKNTDEFAIFDSEGEEILCETIGQSESFEEVDDTNLIKIIEKCAKEGNNLPIIKQELWCKIQYNRLLSGQGELNLDTENNKKPIKYKLTEDDIRKRNRRRLQNRESAIRCRLRQQIYEEELKGKIQSMESQRDELKTLIQTLQREKNILSRLVHKHSELCCNVSEKFKSKRYVSLLTKNKLSEMDINVYIS